jgi:hypothetical protein
MADQYAALVDEILKCTPRLVPFLMVDTELSPEVTVPFLAAVLEYLIPANMGSDEERRDFLVGVCHALECHRREWKGWKN